MKKLLGASLLIATMSLAAAAQDAKTAIDNAKKAMGAMNLTSIAYTGRAADVNFIQTRDINGPWPLRPITAYSRTIDLNAVASRATGTTNNPGLFGGPGVPGVYNGNVLNLQPTATWAQQLEYWVTPWGFLKGAAANNATVKNQKWNGKNYSVVTWSPASPKAPSGHSYKVDGYIGAEGTVDRVETWVDHDMYGDLEVDTIYADYKDFGGIKAPTRITQKRGGFVFFEVNVDNARQNPADLAQLLAPPARGGAGGGAPAGGAGRGAAAPPAGGVPPVPGGAAAAGGAGRGAAAPGAAGAPAAAGAPPAAGAQGGRGAGGGAPAAAAPAPASTKLADGLYQINGGYNALAVEFKDYIAVIEGPQSLARGKAVVDEVKKLFPTKPIKYVINTHPHSDHSSGLAPFVADGATIVTQQNNKKFMENTFSAPRTLVGDDLAKASKKPKVEGVSEKKVIKDENHSIELYHVIDKDPENVHSNGIIVAFLPKEKILFQADFTVNNGQAANAFTASLAEHVERLNLDFDKYISVHNSAIPQTKADLMKAAELKKAADKK